MTENQRPEDSPTCEISRTSIDAVREKRAEHIRKYGFTIDMVFPTKEGETWNYHTHGVKESWDHPDFQLVLNIGQRNAMGIFHLLVDKIKEGEKFMVGIDYDCIAEGFPTRFISAKECGREVLRLIVPDPKGNLDENKMDSEYAAQYQNLDS